MKPDVQMLGTTPQRRAGREGKAMTDLLALASAEHPDVDNDSARTDMGRLRGD